jgi:uncharacterized DUF497 family protein
MRITFDPAKRDATLRDRGVDFLEAETVFAGPTADVPDLRFDYGEPRIVTFGYLDTKMVAVVWTPTNDGRRVISMRKANDRERRTFGQRLGNH